MCGIQPKLRGAILPLILVTVIASGCHSGSDDTAGEKQLPAGSGQALNPSGQPRTPEEARIADLQRKSGESAAAQMAKGAKEMQDAKARTGEK